jgi:hypothetical protein
MIKLPENKQSLQPDPSKLSPFLYGDKKVTIYTGKGPFQVPEIEYRDGQGGTGRRPIKVERNEFSEPE